MRIAFAGNHRRTELFAAAAELLESRGHSVFWVSTGSRRMRSLLAPYAGRVLDVSKYGSADCAELTLLRKNSPLTVREIIAADRILRRKSEDTALSYISSVFSSVSNFIHENSIDIFFSEATWAHELAAAAACSYRGIPFLAPVCVRYPSGRFAFFKGIFQSEFVRTSDAADMNEGSRLYKRFLEQGNRPFYMQPRHKYILGPLAYHIKRYMTGDTSDMTVPSLADLIKKGVKTRVSAPVHPDRPGGEYVCLPLQCRPEATLDVLGGAYRDVYQLIKSAADALPEGLTLAVREHPKQPSSPELYRRASKLPGVEMVSLSSDWHGLIKNASAVISVSGTACYEAGLYGIPAVSFADMFFNGLPTVKKCAGYEHLKSDLEDVMGRKPDSEAAVKFLAELYSASYEGYAESPDTYPDALSPDNVKKIADAFEDVINYYSSSKSATADSI